MSIDQTNKWQDPSRWGSLPIASPPANISQSYVYTCPWQPTKADWDSLVADIAAIKKAVVPQPKQPSKPERAEEF